MNTWDKRLIEAADRIDFFSLECGSVAEPAQDVKNIAAEIGEFIKNQTAAMPQDVRDAWEHLGKHVVPVISKVDLSVLVEWLRPRFQMLDDLNQPGTPWLTDLCEELGLGNGSMEQVIQKIRHLKLLASAYLHLSAPTHRNIRSGALYMETGRAELQASSGPVSEGATLAVYVGLEDGKHRARPDHEFDQPDRFEKLPQKDG